MARLSTKKRNSLPDSAFAGPGRTFPENDKAHAIAAKRLVGRSVSAGNTTESEAAKIRAKADRVLGKGAKPKNMIARPAGY